jgi:hypothetical protein
MILDHKDLDLLRLTGVCKDIPADCSPIRSKMFSPESLSALAGTGYIRKHKSGQSYRLTEKGYSLLDKLGHPEKRDAYPVGNGGTLRRRLEVAKAVLSAYRWGFNVFGGTDVGAFIPSFYYRRESKGSILGASKLCGILRFADKTVPVYFVSEQFKLNVSEEMAAIQKVSALLQMPAALATCFLADSPEILERFENPFDFRDRRAVWGDSLTSQTGWKLYEPPATPLGVSVYA